MPLPRAAVRNPVNGAMGYLRLATASISDAMEAEEMPAPSAKLLAELKMHMVDALLCMDVCEQVLENMNSVQKIEAGLLKPKPVPMQIVDTFQKVKTFLRPLTQVMLAPHPHQAPGASVTPDVTFDVTLAITFAATPHYLPVVCESPTISIEDYVTCYRNHYHRIHGVFPGRRGRAPFDRRHFATPAFRSRYEYLTSNPRQHLRQRRQAHGHRFH